MTKPMAKTFFDEEQVEVEVLSKPSSTGLCKCKFGEKTFARNVVQLDPMNEEAKKLLGK